MLHLSGHDRAVYAFALEGLDQLGKFSQRKPIDSSGAVGFDLGKRFFLDSSDDNLITAGAGSIEHEKGKATVARDQAYPFRTGQMGLLRIPLRRPNQKAVD